MSHTVLNVRGKERGDSHSQEEVGRNTDSVGLKWVNLCLPEETLPCSCTLRHEQKSPGCSINPAIPITHTDVPPLFSFTHILIKRSESSIKMLLNGLFTFSLYVIYYAFSKCVHIYSEGLFGIFMSVLQLSL